MGCRGRLGWAKGLKRLPHPFRVLYTEVLYFCIHPFSRCFLTIGWWMPCFLQADKSALLGDAGRAGLPDCRKKWGVRLGVRLDEPRSSFHEPWGTRVSPKARRVCTMLAEGMNAEVQNLLKGLPYEVFMPIPRIVPLIYIYGEKYSMSKNILKFVVPKMIQQ